MARSARILAGTLAVMALMLAAAAIALVWWAQSETAFEWAAARLVAASGGRLSITGARGSLAHRLTFERVAYKDEAVELVATGVTLEWQPTDLRSRRVTVTTLAADEIAVTLLPSTRAAALPDSLALPVEVGVERLRVARLVLHSGANRSSYSGLEAGYAGGAARHAITKFALHSDFGTIVGDLTLAAVKPFALGGALDWADGEGARRTYAHAQLGGALERITAALKGGAGPLPLEGAAVLAPFADSWLPELALAVRGADLAAIDAALPRTALSGTLNAGTDARGRLAGTLALSNAAAGTWTDRRLPLRSIATRIAAAGGELRFDDLRATLGAGGRIAGGGRIAAAGSEWDLALADLDLRAIHKPLRATRLSGRVKATLAGGRQIFDATLAERGLTLAASGTHAGGRIELRRFNAKAGRGEISGKGELSLSGLQPFAANAQFAHFDPAEFGDFPGASISGEAQVSGQLAPEWRADARFALKDSKFRGAPLAGSGSFKVSARELSDTSIDLRAGANRLRAKGAFGAAGDALDVEFDGQSLAQLDPRLAGKLAASGKLGGTLALPVLAFDAKGEALAFERRYAAAAFEARGNWTGDADPRIDLKANGSRLAAGAVKLDAFTVAATGTLARHAINLSFTAPGADFAALFEGGLRATRASTGVPERATNSKAERASTNGTERASNSGAGRVWTGRIVSLVNRGSLPFALLAPAAFEAGPAHFALGETSADALGGRLALRALRWESGRLTSAGDFTGVPAAPLLALAGVPLAPGSDLRLRGAWAIEATPRLNGTLSLAREAGDLVLREDPALPLRLERLDLDLKFVEDTARAALALRGKQFGDAAGEVAVTPPAGEAPFAPQSTLAGSARLDLTSLRLLDEWIGTAALVDGTAHAQLALAGTLAQPLVTGTLAGERIRIEVPQQGIALKNGRLRAELTERALALQEFSIAGPSGTLAATGTLARREGEGETQIEWRADALRLLDRPDRRLTLAGSGTVGLMNNRLRARGTLKALEGRIEFGRPNTTALGDDVVVVGREAKLAARARRKPPLDLDATLDFGERFNIVGAGLETGLRGQLRVYTSAEGALLATGRVSAVDGSYFAFGQKLSFERGQLYFDGPIDNPGMEIVAVRKNLPVEAGVEVTGTVRAPRVRLTSNPPVPDGEKLAWLVTGHGLDNASAADIGLLQAAASTLINSGDSIPLTRRIARQVGLDDIGVRGGGSHGGALDSQVLTIGKRLSRDLYLEFEQGLAMASNVLRLNYQLTRALSLRVESGAASAFGLIYRRSYE